MPETFRVGDKVETRRSSDIPERWRGKRGVVERAWPSGKVSINFANHPEQFGMLIASPRFENDQVRLLERALIIDVGAKVLVANPAWYRTNGTGNVAPEFYDRICEVRRRYDSGDLLWYVRHPDTQRDAIVHRKYLTVAEEAPPPKFEIGQFALVANPAYLSAETSTWEVADSRFFGKVARVTSRHNHGGQWDLTHESTSRVATIHENWLTFHVETGEPTFDLGALVHVNDTPHEFSGGFNPKPAWAERDVVITKVDGPRCQVRRIAEALQATWLHQDCLSEVAYTPPTVGTHVQVQVGAMARSSDEINQSLSAYAHRVGVVHGTDSNGNTHVRLTNGDNLYVWAPFLKVLTAEEAANIISPNDIVRVAMNASRYAEGGDNPSGVQGRVCRVSTDYDLDQGIYYVQDERTGESAYIHRAFLTKVETVSTVESGDVQCMCCFTAIRRNAARNMHGYRYCDDCIVNCATCGQHRTLDSRGGFLRVVNGAWSCDSCTQMCRGCNIWYPSADLEPDPTSSRLYRYCSNCRSVCVDDTCEQVIYGPNGGYCAACVDDVGRQGLGRWRSTRPTMWLGGPVRKEGGFYIGFEDEISASGDFRIKPLRTWALAHLGHKQALDPKPDGSVNGFEIATQPMTPAFFESVDWESLMEVINTQYPLSSYDYEEPDGHGLHVHIGRQAFRRMKTVHINPATGRRFKKPKKMMVTDAGMLAGFTYLLSKNHHELTRIGRRDNEEWAERVVKPVSAALIHQNSEVRGKQWEKIQQTGVYVPRGAVNLTNERTIEIRVFKSTRDADELRDAVRVVYLAAEYIRYLRGFGSINPKGLTWEGFATWVHSVKPEAYNSIAGHEPPADLIPVVTKTDLMEAFTPPEGTTGLNLVMEHDGDQVPVPVGGGDFEDDEDYDDEEDERDPF